MGRSLEEASSAIRSSLGRDNTEAEIDQALAILASLPGLHARAGR